MAQIISLKKIILSITASFFTVAVIAEVPTGSTSDKPCYQQQDFNALRRCARERSWVLGSLDESVAAYRVYLDSQPNDSEVWLEYAQVEIWRGDYRAAKTALDYYLTNFGSDDKYQKKYARLLARAERPNKARTINQPLLSQHPDDYDINYTNTLILRADNQPAKALDSLKVLQALRPESKDTADIIRFVRTPNRSHLRASASFYDDSDDITNRILGLDGRYVMENKNTALIAGYDSERITAKAGQGLDTINGKRAINVDSIWMGAEHRWSPWLWTELRLGISDADAGDSVDTHQLQLQLEPHDKLTLQLQHQRALYDISPRSASLDIVQTSDMVHLNWRPNLDWTLDSQISGSDFSDENKKQQLIISPRRAVIRQEQFKLDVGVSGEWFGFKEDVNHGYYDPDWYRRYALTAFAYWKIDDDNGIGTSMSLGWHQDNSMSSYEFGEDISVEGYFGIFRDWYLTVRAGYVERYNTVGNYDGLMLSSSLMRRF